MMYMYSAMNVDSRNIPSHMKTFPTEISASKEPPRKVLKSKQNCQNTPCHNPVPRNKNLDPWLISVQGCYAWTLTTTVVSD